MNKIKIASFLIIFSVCAGMYHNACAKKVAKDSPKSDKKVAASHSSAKTPAAVVNGEEISREDIMELMKNAPDTASVDEKSKQYALLRDRLISLTILLQDAVKRGFDKDPRFLKALDLRKKELLIQMYFQSIRGEFASKFGKKEIDKKMDEIQKNERVIHYRHMIVGDESTAKRIVEALKMGQKFDDLAKKYALDKNAKTDGKTLEKRAPKELRDVATGEVKVLPLNGQFLVFKVEDRQKLTDKDQLRGLAEEAIGTEKMGAHIKALTDGSTIKKFDIEGAEDKKK